MANFIEELYYGNIEPQNMKKKKSKDVLKEQNQMEWVQRMNNIRNRVEEIINEEIFK